MEWTLNSLLREDRQTMRKDKMRITFAGGKARRVGPGNDGGTQRSGEVIHPSEPESRSIRASPIDWARTICRSNGGLPGTAVYWDDKTNEHLRGYGCWGTAR